MGTALSDDDVDIHTVILSFFCFFFSCILLHPFGMSEFSKTINIYIYCLRIRHHHHHFHFVGINISLSTNKKKEETYEASAVNFILSLSIILMGTENSCFSFTSLLHLQFFLLLFSSC
jgi:hypothetical protein